MRGSWGRLISAAAVVALALSPGCLAFADGSRSDLLPTLKSSFTLNPAPIPTPGEGRIPVSLRLADRIATTDGSHPQVTTRVRFELDKGFRLDMADVDTCSPLQGRDSGRSGKPCDVGQLATGRLEAETQFPEEEPVLVAGEATAYKTGPRKMLIDVFLGAPVTGSMLIPVEIGEVPGDRYGIKLTLAVPKLAGGSGSLTYLGLRFRKGLFSAACPSGSLQSGEANTLADGTVAAVGSIVRC